MSQASLSQIIVIPSENARDLDFSLLLEMTVKVKFSPDVHADVGATPLWLPSGRVGTGAPYVHTFPSARKIFSGEIGKDLTRTPNAS